MNPIYKFELTAGGSTIEAHPVYGDDLAIDYELAQGQQFYRGKLSGKLTFKGTDCNFIVSRSFDTKFSIVIYISRDGGQSWTSYWRGQFYKTDCEFNDDDNSVEVQPEVADQYNDILAGLDKEFNLLELVPVCQPVKLDKRPMIQIYVPGQTVIGCFLSGMYWEQSCTAVADESILQTTYHFWKNKAKRIVEITQQASPVIPDSYFGTPLSGFGTEEFTNGAYKFVHSHPSGGLETFQIVRVSDSQAMWSVIFTNQPAKTFPIELTLTPVSGSGASGSIKLYIHDVSVFARYMTDVESYPGITLYDIPTNDIVENNRNYSKVTGYDYPSTIIFSDELSNSPTKWGLYDTRYYVGYNEGNFPVYYPIARAGWGRLSLWFTPGMFDSLMESSMRREYTLKDAYPIWSVISVLLGQIAPGIAHQGNAAFSQFLYTENPLKHINQRLFISPKSNLINSGYDQPAQKALITLGKVLNMLRDCFRCYWWVEDNKLRIEHIEYFRRGGRYTGDNSVSIDLTALQVPASGKPWSFGVNKYSFDKPETVGRYQFGWMDDVTEPFEGLPIDIVSGYVEQGNIENIDITDFTSDVDYILLNPGAISQDGFVLLAPEETGGTVKHYKLPYLPNYTLGVQTGELQNGWASFMYLQDYYRYDMPAKRYKIGSTPRVALGTKRLKYQSLKFPVLVEPNLQNLISTGIGDGNIRKMSVNLSSRIAVTELRYDTE